MYEVRRKIGSSGTFAFVGAAGSDRTFVDATVPLGSSTIIYEVTGFRNTVRGPASQFVVNFGVAGGGITVSEGVKLAA